MRRALLPIVFAITACGSKNTFVVEDPKGLIQTATLEICRSKTPLERHDNSFELTTRVRCQEGDVRLVYKNGRPGYCHIGYIDGPQQFRFRAGPTDCSLIL